MTTTTKTQTPERVPPPYEAAWVLDDSQDPAKLLDRHRRNAAMPAAHEIYRKLVEEKADKFGVIHVDPATGYKARFHPVEAPADTGAEPTPAAPATPAAGDDRDAKIADLERQLADLRRSGSTGD